MLNPMDAIPIPACSFLLTAYSLRKRLKFNGVT